MFLQKNKTLNLSSLQKSEDIKFGKAEMNRYKSVDPEKIVRKGKVKNSFLLYFFVNAFLRTKSVTKKEMNKCMAEIYDPGGIRTRAAPLINQHHNH